MTRDHDLDHGLLLVTNLEMQTSRGDVVRCEGHGRKSTRNCNSLLLKNGDRAGGQVGQKIGGIQALYVSTKRCNEHKSILRD